MEMQRREHRYSFSFSRSSFPCLHRRCGALEAFSEISRIVHCLCQLDTPPTTLAVSGGQPLQRLRAQIEAARAEPSPASPLQHFSADLGDQLTSSSPIAEAGRSSSESAPAARAAPGGQGAASPLRAESGAEESRWGMQAGEQATNTLRRRAGAAAAAATAMVAAASASSNAAAAAAEAAAASAAAAAAADASSYERGHLPSQF